MPRPVERQRLHTNVMDTIKMRATDAWPPVGPREPEQAGWRRDGSLERHLRRASGEPWRVYRARASGVRMLCTARELPAASVFVGAAHACERQRAGPAGRAAAGEQEHGFTGLRLGRAEAHGLVPKSVAFLPPAADAGL
ncbi:hypothetical protein DIPPA_07954 [Diplonema papillatum]|nr:hypothetical protein DIPPA_07916 [Diplonema papillatum]KAJ9467672.1 hypothetical protein DIPPA_07954 [Diplonema papillatum]